MKSLLKILIVSITTCLLIVSILWLSISQPIPKTTSTQTPAVQSQSEIIRPKGFDQENDLSAFWTIALSFNFIIILVLTCYLVFKKQTKNIP